MLQLTVSNRLESLADALAERIERAPLADPFAAERIVVPHSGVGRWLQLRLAQRWGIAAQLKFELPAQVIGPMLAALSSTSDGETSAVWERAVLRWRLLALLERVPKLREFTPLRAYLDGASESPDPLKPWQLACRLADVFDAYQVYRPDWLTAWMHGARLLPASEDEIWQAALWRELRKELIGADRGSRMLALIDRLMNGLIREAPEGSKSTLLPTRLSLFGALPLGPLQMRWASALAARTDVAVFHCAPSSAYWGDLRSPRELARQRTPHGSALVGAHDAAEPMPPVSALLASLGSRAREAQQLQIEHWLDGSVEQERWEEADSGQLLGWLQNTMLNLEESSPPDVVDGANLRVHACASARREVEVMLDELLQLFERDPSLRPHDVAIMAPSLDRYAPLIEAVLAATPASRRLPITLADGRADHLHPLIQRYLWLLRLPQAGFTRMEVLGLFECAEIRARFELADESRHYLTEWAEALGVVRGLNAAQREAWGEGAADAHTWAAALERLLIGQVAGDNGGVLDDTAPFDSGNGEDAALALGSLWRCLRTLDRWRQILIEPMSTVLGIERMRQLFDAFFKIDGSEPAAADAESAVRDALEALANQIALGDCDVTVASDVLAAALDDALAQPARWQRFLGEGATVCAMVPLRSVPFRVIAVLGLNDGEFPRRTPPAGFDLMLQQPRLGDRQPREDDRQLLLDTLLAARDHLHLSYIGMDAGDGSARPPSPPLAEIVDALRAAFAPHWSSAADTILHTHALVPWAESAFTKRGGSFAAQWWPALQAERAGWRTSPPFVASPLALTPMAGALDVERLLRFYRHPARAFLCDVLQLSRARWISDQEGDEADIIDKRAAGMVLDRMLKSHAQSTSIASCLERITAEAQIPAGLAGAMALRELSEKFDGAINLLADGRIRREVLDVDVQIAMLPLCGQLEILRCSEGLLAMGVNEPAGADWLALGLARELLIQRGMLAHDAECIYLEVPLDNTPRLLTLKPLLDVQSWLSSVADGWAVGQTEPLPLPQRSAFAFARSSDAETSFKAARAKWNSTRNSRGEGADEDWAIAFRDQDVSGLAAFAEWSIAIYAPLAERVHAERRK